MQRFEENQMRANSDKCQFIHSSKDEDILFECRLVKIESIIKLLGIKIDKMLKSLLMSVRN